MHICAWKRAGLRSVAAASFVSVAAFGLGSQSAPSGGLSTDEISDQSVITLHRNTCERHCPVYRIVFFGDGTVIYYGEYYVRRKGVFLGHVDRENFRKAIESAQKLDYFSLKSDYGYHGTSGCESRIPDAPIVSTSISAGGQSHAIIHHHRCGGPTPERLTELENEIEKLANIEQFSK